MDMYFLLTAAANNPFETVSAPIISLLNQTCQGRGASGQRESKEQPEECDHRLCVNLRADCSAEAWHGRNAVLDEQCSRDSKVGFEWGCRKMSFSCLTNFSIQKRTKTR